VAEIYKAFWAFLGIASGQKHRRRTSWTTGSQQPRRRTLGCRHLHATPNASARYYNIAYPPTGLFKHDQAQTPTPQKTR